MKQENDSEDSQVIEFEEGITEEEFSKLIGNKEKTLVIFDIYTTWCGPCKEMRPIFSKLALKFPQITFVSINLDETEWLSCKEEYHIDSIPTFLFFKENKFVWKQVGGLTQKVFEKIITRKLIETPKK
jgi:thiol-disulfide isomerase/thioredoxin